VSGVPNTKFPHMISTSLLKTDILVIMVHWENIGTFNSFYLLIFYVFLILNIALTFLVRNQTHKF